MRKFYNEFFYIPKHGKIREKVMIVRVAMAVCVIVSCLAAMGFTAYAYFSYDVYSQKSIIQAANFDTVITVTDQNGNELEVLKGDNFSKKANLSAGVKYTVVLKPHENSTSKTGFVIVELDGKRYHTQQLGADGNNKTEQIVFYIEANANTTVSFSPCWGTSAYYSEPDVYADLYIVQNESIKSTAAGTGISDGGTVITDEDTVTDDEGLGEDLNKPDDQSGAIDPPEKVQTEVEDDKQFDENDLQQGDDDTADGNEDLDNNGDGVVTEQPKTEENN